MTRLSILILIESPVRRAAPAKGILDGCFVAMHFFNLIDNTYVRPVALMWHRHVIVLESPCFNLLQMSRRID